jgi:hypothetical protein
MSNLVFSLMLFSSLKLILKWESAFNLSIQQLVAKRYRNINKILTRSMTGYTNINSIKSPYVKYIYRLLKLANSKQLLQFSR